MRSDTFAVAVGLIARAQRTVQQEASRTTRRVLHQLNLPAGSDVTRILNEIGQLRRQVRELTAELEATKAELARAQAPGRKRGATGGTRPRS